MLGDDLRRRRRAHGLTQAQLADRAGVSRQLIGAVEAGRHLPRVDAAAALARALGCTVEDLLAGRPRGVVGVLAPPGDGEVVRVAAVGERLVCVPASPAGESWTPGDGIVRGGEVELMAPERPAAVVAGCDPALGLVAQHLERAGGPGALVAIGSSAAALDALRDGRVHAAVVHAADGALPDPVPDGLRRWRLARWRVGLAAPHELGPGWATEALAGRHTVVQREPGAASQTAFERAVAAEGEPAALHGPRAGGHLETAGWARRAGMAAVTIEPAALALGLAFHPLEEHVSELWVGGDHLDVAGVRHFLDEAGGRTLRRRLEAIGGYDLSDSGTEVAA